MKYFILVACIATAMCIIPVSAIDGSLGEGAYDTYSMVIPAATQQIVRLHVPFNADFDLYLKRGGIPTPSDYDYKSATNASWEEIILTNPTSGTYGILIQAVKGSGNYTLRTIYSNENSVVLMNAGQGSNTNGTVVPVIPYQTPYYPPVYMDYTPLPVIVDPVPTSLLYNYSEYGPVIPGGIYYPPVIVPATNTSSTTTISTPGDTSCGVNCGDNGTRGRIYAIGVPITGLFTISNPHNAPYKSGYVTLCANKAGPKFTMTVSNNTWSDTAMTNNEGIANIRLPNPGLGQTYWIRVTSDSIGSFMVRACGMRESVGNCTVCGDNLPVVVR